MKCKIGFIGASKTGTVLARYFQSKGLKITGFYSRNKQALQETLTLVKGTHFVGIEALVKASDIIFITTKDSDIEQKYLEINTDNKYIYHCSGILSSDIFDMPAKGKGSVHPMTSFHTKQMSLDDVNQVTFAIEGDAAGLEQLSALLNFTQNPFVTLNKNKKVEYHIACVAMTNFLVGLVSFAQNLWDDCLEKDNNKNKTHELLLNFAEGVIHKLKEGASTKEALTGPLIRQDYETLKKHMKQLTGNDKKIYQTISLHLLEQFIFDDSVRQNLLKILR